MLGKKIPLYRLLFPFNAVWVLYVLLFGQRIVANTVYQNTPLVFRHFSTNSPQSTKHYLAGTNSSALPTHCKSTNLWLNICLTPTKTFCTASPLPDYIYLKVMHASTSCWQYGWRLTFDRNVLDHSLTCCHAHSGWSFWLISSLITPPSPSDCFPDFPSLPFLNHSCFTPFLSYSSAPSP